MQIAGTRIFIELNVNLLVMKKGIGPIPSRENLALVQSQDFAVVPRHLLGGA